ASHALSPFLRGEGVTGCLHEFALNCLASRMETRSRQQSALPLTRNGDAIRALPAEEQREVKCASQAAPTSCRSLRMVYRIPGAFFFGAASAIGSELDGIADRRKGFVVDFAAVPFLDSTAANVLGRVAAKGHRQ